MTALRRMALALAVPATAALAACGGDSEVAEDDAIMADTQSIMVSEVGLQTPESVFYDATDDIYLVSNINGAPTDVDGNGFISQVAPNGEVSALKWIDGLADGVTLNAPKGLAVKGDTLFVADITWVRAFHRVTGEPLGGWEVPGATFLNDLAVGEDGTLYVSDSGLNPDFTSSGTDAIYRFEDGAPVAVVQDTALASPNGIDVRGDNILVVSFGAAEVRTVSTETGEMQVVAELPGDQLDGVVILSDGSMLVSSWGTSAVYWVPVVQGEIETVVDAVPSPADIGWDTERSRVLIPVFNENRLILRALNVPVEPAPVEQQPRY